MLEFSNLFIISFAKSGVHFNVFMIPCKRHFLTINFKIFVLKPRKIHYLR